MRSARDRYLEDGVLEAILAYGEGAALDGEPPQLEFELDLGPGAAPLRVSARREDAWLLLQASGPGGSPLEPRALLEAGSGLPGGVKFAAMRGSAGAAAALTRAELPLTPTDAVDFGASLCDTLHGFALAPGNDQ